VNPNNPFDQWHDQISFYVAGTLPTRERLALADHLRGCAACRAEVETWRSIAQAVRDETAARVALHDVPTLDISQLPAIERKPGMLVNNSTIAKHPTRPLLRSTTQTGWLGLSASFLIVVLVITLTLNAFTPILNNAHGGFVGSAVQSSSTPPVLGPLPNDCPPAPLAMSVTPNVDVAVGGYPLWAVMGSYSAALAFYGEGQHTASGWSAKVLWLAQSDYQGAITVHGANLKTNAPLRFDPFPTGIGPTTTTLTIDDRVLNISPVYQHWITLPSTVYVPEAGCYSLEMDWAGGSWRITFPAGLISNAMETATASAMPTMINTPAPSVSPTPNSTDVAFYCSVTSVPLNVILQATETALPSQLPVTPGQTSPPQATFGPIPMDDLWRPGCPPSVLKLTVTPLPTCAVPANGLQPTASPTAAVVGGIELDCLPSGKGVYTIVCSPTVPMANSLSFHMVLGPPFPSCADMTAPPTLVPKITHQGMPTPSPSPTIGRTATPPAR
jgi:Putative zinc-finger